MKKKASIFVFLQIPVMDENANVNKPQINHGVLCVLAAHLFRVSPGCPDEDVLMLLFSLPGT